MSRKPKRKTALRVPRQIPAAIPVALVTSPDPDLIKTAFWREVALYAVAALVCLAITLCVIHIWDFNPADPYVYDGDGLLHTTVVKSIVENGWYLHIDRLGAPGGLNMADFPMCDNLCCGIMRLLALGTSNPFLIQNLFFLLTFPLTTLIAFWAARQFRLSAGPASLVGVLYALLPYHFMRGTWHLFLSAYFLVPALLVVAWWIMRGMLLAPRGITEAPDEHRTRRRRLWLSVGICVLMGCNMVYYPFFACYLLAVAAGYAACHGRGWRHALLALVLSGLIGGLVVANLLPTVLYVRQHGPSQAGQRSAVESEVFGLKLVQMLLPASGHRQTAFADLAARYTANFPLVTENSTAALGLIGSAGMLGLFAWLLCARPGTTPSGAGVSPAPGTLVTILHPVGVLMTAAFLLGTIGGFASVFALFVSPQIRSYNRISVYIAFCALLTVAAVLDHLVWRKLRSRPAKILFLALIVGLVAFGVWDQTNPSYVQDYLRARHANRDDARFFAKVEASVPPGTMVFQLPAEPFPEAGPNHGMADYSHMRAYIQTRTLRWSYGAIRGRPEENANESIAMLTPVSMTRTLAAEGFGGICIDGYGYADGGRDMIQQISAALGTAPLMSRGQRTAFFNLTPLAAKMKQTMDAASLEALTHPLRTEWQKSFSGLESNETENWRWCGPSADLVLYNDSVKFRKKVQIHFLCRTMGQSVAQLHVSGDLMHEDLHIGDDHGEISTTVELPPGAHVIHFECDGKPENVPQDSRKLVWRAMHTEIKDVTTD